MISMGKGNYTVWIFYLISDESVYGTEPNDIYAYTTDMELAGQFASERNMDKFYMRKVKMDNKELNQLYKDYMESDLVSLTSTTRKGNKMKACECSIIVTKREGIACTNMASLYTNENLYSNLLVLPTIFKRKYQKALLGVRYSPLYEYLKGLNIIHDDVRSNMYPDMINILLEEFGELFDRKET